jgi:hypothetical protein
MTTIELARQFNLDIAFDSLEKEIAVSGHNLDTGARFNGEAVINEDDGESIKVKLYISFDGNPVLMTRGGTIEAAVWNAYKMGDDALYLGDNATAITAHLNR